MSVEHQQRLRAMIERNGVGVRYFAELLERKNLNFAAATTPVLFRQVGKEAWDRLWATFDRRHEQQEGAPEPLEQLREFVVALPSLARAANIHIADLESFGRIELMRLRAADEDPRRETDAPPLHSVALLRTRPIHACRAQGRVADHFVSDAGRQGTPSDWYCLVACRPRIDGFVRVVRLSRMHASLLRLCDGKHSILQIAEKLTRSQEPVPSRLNRAVEMAVAYLVSLGLIDVLPIAAEGS
ncbi:hypothetical protein [Devosia sp. CN2-171]|uniref:hypothetical protein n=1 Tax=Devosia sp. CN2-171 TaxID=3400909 RepID=UPI003BF886BE